MNEMVVAAIEHAEGPAHEPARAGDPSVAAPTPDDQELVWTVATLLIDVVREFAVSVTEFLYERLPALPRDDALVKALEEHAEADAREVLTTLRAGMDPSAHETPVEALAHARYLRQRGVPFQTLVSVYQLGFTMFREMVAIELRERANDPRQLDRLGAAADAYSFPFVGTTMTRLAYEFGSYDAGWTPTSDDPVLAEPGSIDRARRLREQRLARGAWPANAPEDSTARRNAERLLKEFTDTLATGVRRHGLDDRLALAGTTVTITLADEPDLSSTLLLDRSPIEVLGGVGDSEARMWIASVDLQRTWSPDFYLPMAIAKGRVRIAGPIRKFLRIVPVLRAVAEPPGTPAHD